MGLNFRQKLKGRWLSRNSLTRALLVQPLLVLIVAFGIVILLFNTGVQFVIDQQAKLAIQAQYDQLNAYYTGETGTLLDSSSSVLNTTYIILNEELVTQYRSTSEENSAVLRDSVRVLDYFYEHDDEWELGDDDQDILDNVPVILPKRISSGEATYLVKLEQYEGTLKHYYVEQGGDERLYYIMVFVNITALQDFVNWSNMLLLLVMVGVGLGALGTIFVTARKVDWSFKAMKDYIVSVGNREEMSQPPALAFAEFHQVGETVHTMSQMIEANQRSQRLFFQNASHELRTPLMSIQGYAEGIQAGVVKDTTASAAIIVNESRKMSQLVDDILNLSALEMVPDRLQLELVMLDELLYDLTWRIKPLADAKGVRLSHEFTGDLAVQADDTLLEKAIGNILANAVRYAKTWIQVKASQSADTIRLTIANDGPAIPEKDLPHIFERFYKGDEGHFGIGLALTKDVIQRHGGEVTVQSQAAETVFQVVLPQ